MINFAARCGAFMPRRQRLTASTSLRNMTPHPSRRMATWTPLAAAFNRKPEKKILSIFNKQRRGLFGYPQLADSAGFYLMKEQAEIDTDRLVREATSSSRTRNVVEIFDELSDALCRVADMSECIRVLHGDSNFASAAEEANSQMNGLVEDLNTNRSLYLAIKKTVDTGRDVKPMDDVDRHVANLFLVDFELAGIHLEEQKRRQVVNLNAKIMAAGLTFARSCYEPHHVEASIIPEAIKPYFYQDGQHIIINNLMSDAPNESVREAAYKVFLMPDKHQLDPLRAMLSYRFHLGKLVGYNSYSERVNKYSIFGSSEKISLYLETLSRKLSPFSQKDLQLLLDLKKKENPRASAIYPWDMSYFTSQARKENTELTSKFDPYFPLGACMEGLSQIFHSIYDVHFVVEDPCDEDLWCSDVYKLSVRTGEDEIMGYIYCDFYQRQDKSSQDCHFTIQGGRQLADGSYQLPKVVLSLNYNPPQSGTPCLMNFAQIDNLFHEMGHAMHSMLGRTRYQHVTGTRTSTDFAEIPSTLMEYFASDSRVLAKMSKHYKTGISLPEEILKDVCQSRKRCSALEFHFQALYSIVDQAYHGSTEPTDPLKIYATLHDQHLPLQYFPNTAWPLRFGHLYSYGARYFAYSLARSIATDIWQKLFKDDPFSRDAGRKFRDRLLCHGGGKPPLDLITSTLEHIPTIDELVDALVDQTKG